MFIICINNLDLQSKKKPDPVLDFILSKSLLKSVFDPGYQKVQIRTTQFNIIFSFFPMYSVE